MKIHINHARAIGQRDIKIYGHFIEHFHRQIYGGLYDPASPLADESGLRIDVMEAMRKIKVPVLRASLRLIRLGGLKTSIPLARMNISTCAARLAANPTYAQTRAQEPPKR